MVDGFQCTPVTEDSFEIGSQITQPTHCFDTIYWFNSSWFNKYMDVIVIEI